VSAIIGTTGQDSNDVTISVGGGGTVYLAFSRSGDGGGEWFFSPPQALKLAELIERAARHYDPDTRTLAEQTDEQLRLVTRAMQDANREVEWLRESIQRITELHTETAIRASLKELLLVDYGVEPMTYRQALAERDYMQ
jgi:hypothetical protein